MSDGVRPFLINRITTVQCATAICACTWFFIMPMPAQWLLDICNVNKPSMADAPPCGAHLSEDRSSVFGLLTLLVTRLFWSTEHDRTCGLQVRLEKIKIKTKVKIAGCSDRTAEQQHRLRYVPILSRPESRRMTGLDLDLDAWCFSGVLSVRTPPFVHLPTCGPAIIIMQSNASNTFLQSHLTNNGLYTTLHVLPWSLHIDKQEVTSL